jgi:putative NIF3 family GTP cyclohydrolase 1 type 2
MITVQTIMDYVQQLSGHVLNRDEGVQHGSAQREVQRVLVAWMATAEALEYAGGQGFDLFLGHESLYYPYDAAVRQDNPIGWEHWQTNRQRRDRLERYDLTFLRVHGSLDEICIFDDFASLLKLGEPVAANGLVKVYEIVPRPLSALIAQVKEQIGMPAVRVSCPRGMEQSVHRVGLPWGGLGLFVNVGYQQRLIELGCDVLIAGESDDYGLRFSAECGISMIETGHEISENSGLQHFGRMLQERFPQIYVEFYLCQPSWQMA